MRAARRRKEGAKRAPTRGRGGWSRRGSPASKSPRDPASRNRLLALRARGMRTLLPAFLGRGEGPSPCPPPSELQHLASASWPMAPVWPMFHSQPVPWQRGWAQRAAGGSPHAGVVGPGRAALPLATPCSPLAGKKPRSHGPSPSSPTRVDHTRLTPVGSGLVLTGLSQGSSVALDDSLGVLCAGGGRGGQNLLKTALPLSLDRGCRQFCLRRV